jgi:hypothetical protein
MSAHPLGDNGVDLRNDLGEHGRSLARRRPALTPLTVLHSGPRVHGKLALGVLSVCVMATD